MLYTSSNHTILLNGQFISVHAAQTILAKAGRALSLQQIRSRNRKRTLSDAALDKPTSSKRVAVNELIQARKRQEMATVMATIDAAKAKLGTQI